MSTSNSTTDIATLVSHVVSEIEGKMTDVVFLVIQTDHELMRRYLDLIRKHGVDTVNQEIGKAVKAELHHAKDGERNENPRSTLIQSYQMHTK